MIATDRLADLFVQLADTLVDDFDVVDLLHGLCEHCASISGAGAVGLMLADQQGRLQFMTSSNEVGRQLEMIQLETGEGPCLDCFGTGRAVVNADLATAAARWPRFTPPAIEAGYRSVHAFPMRLRDQTIGALNLFGETQDRFAADEVRVIQSLADVATIAILQDRAVARAETLTEQLQGALASRIVVEQAKGVLATRLNVGVDEAFQILRDSARSNRQRLVELARAVVTGDVSGVDTPGR